MSTRKTTKNIGKRSIARGTTVRVGVAAAITEKWSFENPPPAIPQIEIKERITADVIVVGAGLAGLTAAGSAAEAGAKTILLEKGSSPSFRGFAIAAINSKLQKEEGIEVDRDKVITELMTWSGYWADQTVVRLWADRDS